MNFFKSKILDDLYESRGEEFEKYYLKYLVQKEEIRKTELSEDELVKFIQKSIQDENTKKKLIKKLNKFEEDCLVEMHFWNKEYYKLGFVDGNTIRTEIRRLQHIFSCKNNNYENDAFFNGFMDNFLDAFENERIKRLSKREEYKEFKNKIAEIEEKYPNIRRFIEDEEVINLNKEELNAVLKIIDYERNIGGLSNEESFKIGLNADEIF